MYVTPNTSTPCPGNPCYNLTTYVQNSATYFQSDSTFIFLSGVHQLQSESPALFQDLVNLELAASDDCGLAQTTISTVANQYGFDPYASDRSINYYQTSVQIVCDNPSGLAFINVTNMTLRNLAILNCGSTFNLSLAQNCSVYMLGVTDLILDGVTIQNGTGFGLMAVNVWGDSKITRSSFVANNQYVKNSIQRTSKDGFQCQDEGIVYVNNVSLPLTGGNAYFEYRTQRPAGSATNQLSFSSCLFSLGVDGSLFYKDGPGGTGLTIRVGQFNYNVSISISDSTFYRNQANYGANLYLLLFGPVQGIAISNVSSLKGVGYGSGLTVYGGDQLQLGRSPKFIVSNSTFECNSGFEGVSVVFGTDSSIANTTFSSSGVNIQTYSQFSTCSFVNARTIAYSAFAVYRDCHFQYSPSYYESTASSYMRCNIVRSPSTQNYAAANYSDTLLDYSSLDALYSVISLNGSFTCSHNLRQTNGGCIFLYSSTIVFNPGANVTFSNNTAINGGAIYMSGSSLLNYTSPLSITVSFLFNRAYIFGGAIYVDQPYYSFDSYLYCFYQFITPPGSRPVSLYSPRLAIAYVDGNSAGEAGSVLYGGDTYCLQDQVRQQTTADGYIKVRPVQNYTSVISSDPLYVCQCNSTVPPVVTCSATTIHRYIYPGEDVQLQLATADLSSSIVPGVVLIYENTTETGIAFISVIRTSTTCDTYTVPVSYDQASSNLFFATERSIGNLFQNPFQLVVHVMSCPVGFEVLGDDSPSCACTPLLASYGYSCNVSDQAVQKSGNTWIGYVTNDTAVLGIIGQCPYEYCTNETRVPVTDFDYQCAYNRQKVLCGQCRDGLSTTFGTSQCAECSNYYLLLVLPLAAMGVALVVILMLLNLTVTSGTLNGLIFYANIVRINDTIFFPATQGNGFAKFLSVFVAWLNLDFGIETCFYNGMDSYAKTWLQFVFPCYIFGLIGAIVLAGRLSSRISYLCKYNTIPVLATLILLSYSKILRTTIVIFSFGAIDAGNTTAPLVWLYDGNLKFFGFEHAILFAFGVLITIILIVPYTAVLLLLPCLQSKSDWKFLRWVNKLKPFLDTYAAPYKDPYRFWSGMLILIRFPLYLLFAISRDTNVRLLGVVIAIFLYSIVFCSLSVYKRWNHLILEVFFLTNLMIITVTKLFDPGSSNSLVAAAIIQVAVGCAFVGFIAIVVAHVTTPMRAMMRGKRKAVLAEETEQSGQDDVQLKGASTSLAFSKDDSTSLRETLLL